MKVEYDVSVPRSYRTNPNADAFWGFYDSGHNNAKFSYDSKEEAVNAQKCFCMLTSRNNIFDVIVMRRGNAIYLVRDRELQD